MGGGIYPTSHRVKFDTKLFDCSVGGVHRNQDSSLSQKKLDLFDSCYFGVPQVPSDKLNPAK